MNTNKTYCDVRRAVASRAEGVARPVWRGVEAGAEREDGGDSRQLQAMHSQHNNRAKLTEANQLTRHANSFYTPKAN